MVLIRAVGILLLLAAGLCGVLYLLSGDRCYLRWAGNALKLLAVVALVFFGVLFVDRLW